MSKVDDSAPGLGCLTYEITKAQVKRLQKAIDVVEDICKELSIPGMCVVQYKNGPRRFGTISFSNQVTAKADASVDSLVKLEKLYWDYDASDKDTMDIWEKVDDILQKYKE